MYKYRGDCEFDGLICPFGCDNSSIKNYGTETTLIGWIGGEDPNHQKTYGECLKCNQKFTKHFIIAGRKVWYEKGGHVLLGKPGCCESLYLIHCECDGWMEHSCRSKTITFNGKTPCQPMYYECLNCHKKKPDPRYGEDISEQTNG